MTQHAGATRVRIEASGLRRWTDIVLAFSLLVMILSGLGLFAWHDVPQVEAAIGAFLGIDYEVWSHTHIVSSILFSGAAVSHLRLNWKPLLRHFARRRD
jgi:hypothetical protein